MPDRIIRDEILQSERWLGLPSDTCRVAYVALLLSADALGDLPASPARLYRLWRDFDNVNGPDAAEKIAAPMLQSDMIRFYEVDGTRYLHILRYRQALRWIRRLFPINPWATDEEKQKVAQNSPSANVVDTVRTPSARTERAADTIRSEEKRYDTKRSEATRAAKAEPPVDNSRETPIDANGQTLGEILSNLKTKLTATPPPDRDHVPTAPHANGKAIPAWAQSQQGILRKAAELNLPAHPGENYQAWSARLVAADNAAKASKTDKRPKA